MKKPASIKDKVINYFITIGWLLCRGYKIYSFLETLKFWIELLIYLINKF